MTRSNPYPIIEEHAWQIWLTIVMLISLYLFWNTGIHSDDYSVIRETRGLSVHDYFSPDFKNRNVIIFGLPIYYCYYWAYQFLNQESLWVYDVVKWLVNIGAVWLVYRFASDYLPKDRAVLAALLLVFNPVHETTTYWYPTTSYILIPALIMFAHHLVRHDTWCGGLSLGLLGAFFGYASPPYTFGLSVIFLLEKSYKKAVLFLLPGVFYLAYYFSVAALYPSAERRLDRHLSLWSLLKNFALQVVSFLDSALGPSFFLKIWWAIGSLRWYSLLPATVVIVISVLALRSEPGRISRPLFLGLAAVLLLSFGMFSLTGHYTQMAFNLGNRVTVYGSVIIAFLIASMPLGRRLAAVIALVFVLPQFGLSDNWKSWNKRQVEIVGNIRHNRDLPRLGHDDVLLVSGNMYSHLGPFSHIEFFSQPWVVSAIFRDHVKSDRIMPLMPYVHFDGSSLIDGKFGGRIPVTGNVFLYRSTENQLAKLSPEQLSELVAHPRVEVRHWTQLIASGSVRAAVVGLSPRLSYLFQ